jgi:rubrerythrin
MTTIEQLKSDGWDNCNDCGYFYSKQKLTHCPMCRHPRNEPKSYTQPGYESPSLS